MFGSKSKRVVIAGLMLAVGILLPFVASHSMGLLPGNVFLPMHIPVLLCGFFCGPVYGAVCGFVLPWLNSILTGMPAAYPNAVIMSFELLSYGCFCGLLYRFTGYKCKFRYIYPVLVLSLIAGRIVYCIVATLLFVMIPGAGRLSVITAIVQGVPGILIQLVIVPQIVFGVSRSVTKKYDAASKAVEMIKNKTATCVVVKDNRIVSAESPLGIAHLIRLYDEGILEGTFVADTIIGKAAAMIFDLAGVTGCYGQTMSDAAKKYLEEKGIDATYGERTKAIQNRKGDGMCPMEETVQHIENSQEAVEKLRKKIEELRKEKAK